MPRFDCDVLIDQVTNGSKQELILSNPSTLQTYNSTSGDYFLSNCSQMRVLDSANSYDSNDVLQPDVRVFCDDVLNFNAVPSGTTIYDLSDNQILFIMSGSPYSMNCANIEFIATGYSTSSSTSVSYQPTPTEIIESFGAGFFLFIPVFLAIYGGRLLLKTILVK